MSEKSSPTSLIAALILIAVNLCLLVLSLTVFIVAVWSISAPNSLYIVLQSFGNETLKALFLPDQLLQTTSIAVALAAVFVFCIAMMGLYGALARSTLLLFLYAIIMLLMLLLECALFYYFTSNLVQKGFKEVDEQWAHGVRLAFQCCDKNITAMVNSESKNATLPWSCCGEEGAPNNCTLNLIYSKICSEEISNWLYKYQTAIYSSIAAFHIVLSSCSLLRRPRISTSLLHK